MAVYLWPSNVSPGKVYLKTGLQFVVGYFGILFWASFQYLPEDSDAVFFDLCFCEQIIDLNVSLSNILQVLLDNSVDIVEATRVGNKCLIVTI